MLMKLHGIKARTKRQFKATTDSAHDLPLAPNLIQRNFVPVAPDRVWTTDITYLATNEGWLYLTVMLDLFSRQVVGWAIGPRMTKKLVIDAPNNCRFRMVTISVRWKACSHKSLPHPMLHKTTP